MILLIVCIVLVFVVIFIQTCSMMESANYNEFNAIATVISMNVLLYFAITYIIEKVSLIGWL